MTPRTGRPKITNPLSIDVKVRIDEDTNNRLLNYANKHKISRAETIRKGIDLILESEK